jgi:glycosyltransferase involved in cell wall biosynthesis
VSLALCICTYKRPEELRACLASVLRGSELPDEILVSDDSPDDREGRLVAEAFPHVTYQVGPRRGLGPNRNACLDRVAATHVLFVDDDVVLPETGIATARRVAGDQRTVVTGYERRHVEGVAHLVTPHNTDFLGFQRVPPDGDHRSIVINATVFPRRLFDEARFDEKLRYGTEEVDMARHAVALGYRIRVEPDLRVDHHPSPANRGEYERYVDASRLYGTLKSYWRYERSVPKAVAYAGVGPLHLLGSAVRRRGRRGAAPALRAIGLAARYTYLEARHGHPARRRPDGPRQEERRCAASSAR